MRTLQDMSRVLYGHNWSRLDDWVEALDELAELSDDAIDEVVRLADRDRERAVHA